MYSPHMSLAEAEAGAETGAKAEAQAEPEAEAEAEIWHKSLPLCKVVAN